MQIIKSVKIFKIIILIFITVNFSFAQKYFSDNELLTKEEISFFKLNDNEIIGNIYLNGILSRVLHPENSGKPISYYLFLKQKFIYNWDGSEWILDFKHSFENDDNGNIIFVNISKSESNKLNNKYQIQVKYNHKNIVNEVLLSKFDKEKVVYSSRVICIIDKMDNISEIISFYWNRGRWENKERYTFSYNSHNYLTEHYKYVWNCENWLDEACFKFLYDNNGRISNIGYFIFSDGKWQQTDKFTFFINNSEIEITNQIMKNEIFQDYSNLLLKYSPLNQIQQSSLYIYQNKKPEYFSQSIFNYNKKKQLISIDEKIGQKNEWITNASVQFIYDEKGNCLEQERKIKERSIFIDSEKSIYYYDTHDITRITQDYKFPKDYDFSQYRTDNPSQINNLQYFLPEPDFVCLKIFNIFGQEVSTLVNEYQESGLYTYDLNNDSFPNGIYYYKLQFGDYLSINKLSCY